MVEVAAQGRLESEKEHFLDLGKAIPEVMVQLHELAREPTVGTVYLTVGMMRGFEYESKGTRCLQTYL